MCTRINRVISIVLCVGLLVTTSGCATLAHRTDTSSGHKHSHTTCDARGGTACPWLWGAAALLLAGIIPGVVAVCVDFGTGEWQHAPESADSVTLTSDRSMASN
jgi:uncharacterized protein YceK